MTRTINPGRFITGFSIAELPALEKTIHYKGGSVTEYLGDGILALFPVNTNDRDKSVRRAYRAAKNCIGDTRSIVNDEIRARYRLPALNIGVGMGYSKAIVQLVGISGSRHPKAIGNCVYYASKLSDGVNEIYVDKCLNLIWPKSDGGKLTFKFRSKNGVDGFLVG